MTKKNRTLVCSLKDSCGRRKVFASLRAGSRLGFMREIRDASSLRAGSRLGFMREMRDASGEAAKPSRGFATRVSHLAHKTQTRACLQANRVVVMTIIALH